ncbi:hypothetical protein ACWD25_01760 [Streptomyces sp. NPDC002920]
MTMTELAQPVPEAAARIVPTGGIGIARDRLRVRAVYGERFRHATSVVNRMMPEIRRLRDGGPRADRVSVLADLAAVHLYLTGEWAWLDETLPRGTVGEHLPLARCVASGLRRLRSYRGPVAVRGDAGTAVDWYRGRRVVTERGFWAASAVPAAAAAQAAHAHTDGPGFLVWSLTGRRTGPVDPYRPDRVVFLPGTRFKVLRVDGGCEPFVLMREMFPQEPVWDAGAGRGSWLDESTAAELQRLPPGGVSRFGGPVDRPPGVIVTGR